LCVNELISSFSTNSTEQLISDPCFEFTNSSVNATSFEWDFGDGTESDFVSTTHCFDSVGCYPVTLIAYAQDNGCTDSMVINVCVVDQLIIYVPNAFTPDGERFNTYVCISTIGVKSGEILIFNRWGELVFESKDLDFQWDGTYNGTLIQDGTLTWKFNYTTNSGRTKKITGHITILK
jgi:gliding motility-associated-like protein